MSTTTGMEMAGIYEHTTAILGTASLIMGITLLVLRSTLGNNGIHSKSGLKYLASAIFVLSVINFLEYLAGINNQRERHSLSVVVFAASTELFLIFMAYMSMLSKAFATRRRVCIEIGCIILFTTPALFVSSDNHSLLFDVFFVTGITFYCIKFLCNYIAYRKQMKKTKERVENLLSDDSSRWLQWINSTFYVVLAIGITSIIAPFTNLTILVFYNSFIFGAYFYVYLLVIKKVFIFNKSMAILENDEVEIIEYDPVEIPPSQLNAALRPAINLMDSQQKLLDEWIAGRGYAVVGITASEVAMHLRMNRTKLSYYLKSNLNTTYYDWIAKLRIEDAKQQLKDYPDRAIFEIALNVGIEDRDNFRHLFLKIVGVSPTAYRKQRIHQALPL